MKRPGLSQIRRLGRRARRGPPPAPFVVGVARSGTTLLRLMLDAHPELAIPPETHFIPKVIRACKQEGDRRGRVLETITTHRRWPDFQLDAGELEDRLARVDPLTATEALRCFYALYAEKQGKPRWGDKSTNYVRKMRRIERWLPEARFVHLIRDGRDVALSQVEVHFGPDDVREAAGKWTDEVRGARRQAARLHHYLELRYEELVGDPEPALRRVCAHCELEFDPAMLSYHERAAGRIAEVTRDLEHPGETVPAQARASLHANVSAPPQRDRVARWREEMSERDRSAYEQVAGGLLSELGYELTRTARRPRDSAPSSPSRP